jgi:beta-glucosidase
MVRKHVGIDRRELLGGVLAFAAASVVRSSPETDAPHPQAPELPPLRTDALAAPSGFMWGVATSGHQIEGNNLNSDCWLLENVKPSIYKERSGDACDSYHRYEEDILLLKSFGFDSYRFSLEWSRIEPTPGQFSNAELDHYKRMIDACHRSGIQPAVSFNHFTSPIWFAASGGFLRPDGPDLFARYCDVAARHLADGMRVAFTLNEPQGGRVQRWFPKSFLENRSQPTIDAMAQAAAKAAGSDRWVSGSIWDEDKILEPLIESHKKAVAAIKAARSALPVAVTLAIVDYQPAGRISRIEEVRHTVDGAWLEAAKTGDFVAVQNYGRLLIDDKGAIEPPKGDEPHPESLGNAVRHVHRVTGRPILVSENGLETTDDAKRIQYINGAIASLGRAMSDGVPVLGYFHWSLFDNFEWDSGYAPKFGLVAVDRTTFERKPKPSAAYLGAIAQRGRL